MCARLGSARSPARERRRPASRESPLQRAPQLLERAHELAQRRLLRARALFDSRAGAEELLASARLRAMAHVQLIHHVRDVLDGARDLPTAARLLLGRAFDVLRDEAHLLRALHDQLRSTRLL